MDRRRKKPKKPQTKKKQGGIEAPAQAAIERRLMEEEERLVQLTMELSLKESLVAETAELDASEAQEESIFETQLKSAILAFDHDLETLFDPYEEDAEPNNTAVSLFQQYYRQLMPGGREKAFQEKMQVALLLASVLGLTRVVKYLIVRGALPEMRLLNGWTAMHFAAALGNVAVVRELLRAVPSLNLLHEYKDKAEMTPLDILAQELEQTPVKIPLELLKMFGRWRSHAQSVDLSSLAGNNTQALGSNMFERFGEIDDMDEELMETLRASAESAFEEEEGDDEDDEPMEYDPQLMEHSTARLFAWGTGALHLQGHGDMTSRQFPKLVRSLESNVCISIATSQFMSAAAFADGSAYVWGLTEGMRLGIPTPNTQEVLHPLQLPSSLFGQHAVVQVTLSNYHGAFLTSDGMLFTFGRGREGQLGLGLSLCDSSTLTDPQLPSPLSYLSPKSSTSSLSDSGRRSTTTTTTTPETNSKNPFGAATIPQHATSEFHAAVLTPSGGDAMAHGLTRVKLSSKMKLDDPTFFVSQVACSDSHTAILTQSGHCWTFGNGSKGQLGHDVLRGEHSPRQVRGPGDIHFRHVAAGPTHTVIASQSDVWVFGFGIATPKRQKFAFGTPSLAVKMGLLPSFNICALASGTLHFLILTKEGDLFSWMHGIDKYPVAVNVDTKQLEKNRSQFESSLAHSGFSVHSGSTNSSNLSLSGHSQTEVRSGLDRERHHVVAISCVGTLNYVTTSDGLVFTFTNSQRRSAPFTRLNVQARVHLLAPGRTHFIATVHQPIPPRESYRPPNPPKLLSRHLYQVYHKQLFHDVVFECCDDTRKGHRFILAISPHLNSIFESHHNQTSPINIKLPESTPLIVLDLILSFIYCGHFILPENYLFLDRKRPLGLKPEHKQMLVDLATEWGITQLVDLVLESKMATAPFTTFPSIDGLESASMPQVSKKEVHEMDVTSYRPWMRLMEDHLKALVENPKFCDAILVVGEEEEEHMSLDSKEASPTTTRSGSKSKGTVAHTEIHVHRALMVERSEWLRMTLSMSSGWVEAQTQKVSMPHLSASSARLVLSYLYTDSLPNKENTSLERLRALADLVATADELLLPALKLIVARRLSRMLTPENVASVLDVAETYGADDLQNCIVRWISSNVELLLRLGSLVDLTNHQMALVEEVTLADRGVHPWRYFRHDTEEKILKLASSLLSPLSDKSSASSSAAPQVLATETSLETSQSPMAPSSPTATNSANLSSSHSTSSGSTSSSVYIPPSKRRAMADAEKISEQSLPSGSPTTTPSFSDIQREQVEAERHAAAEAQAQKQKSNFNWASAVPKTATAPPATGRTNHVLTSTSQSLWPSLPMATKPAEALAEQSHISSVPDTPNAPLPANPIPVVATKKPKVLPSPLRDPKTLTAKDAIFTPKSPSPSPTTPSAPHKAATTTSGSSSAPLASETTPKPATPQSMHPKMSAAVAEYKPSAGTTRPVDPVPRVSETKYQKDSAPDAKEGRQATNSQKSNHQPKQSKQSKQGPKRGHNNDLGSSMKPYGTKPSNVERNQRQTGQLNPNTGLTPDEELALALSRSMEEKGIVAIQQEEMALQQHRQKSILEIQDEERQLEEHRMVESYYAARLAEQQRKAQTHVGTDATSSGRGKGSHPSHK